MNRKLIPGIRFLIASSFSLHASWTSFVSFNGSTVFNMLIFNKLWLSEISTTTWIKIDKLPLRSAKLTSLFELSLSEEHFLLFNVRYGLNEDNIVKLLACSLIVLLLYYFLSLFNIVKWWSIFICLYHFSKKFHSFSLKYI